MLQPIMDINCNPTMNDIVLDIIQLSRIIKNSGFNPKYIVGVSRGGLIPAVFLSHELNVPLIPVNFSGSKGAGDKKFTEIEVLPEFDKKDKIIIVDDICDTGDTLTKMVKYYKRQHVEALTAVLYYKDMWPALDINDPKHGYLPTFFMNRLGPSSPWVTFPWEDTNNVLIGQIQA